MDLRASALVLAGGTAGTAARHAVALLLPPVAGWPVATTAVNLVGAFLLGALLAALAPAAPDRPAGTARLLLGTGFLGAFTTYSAFAAETVLLAGAGSAPLAAAFAVLAVAAGIACAAAGAALTRRVRR
ncbi:CrcB protein [Kineococcus xinjiangensis]|uniref:Fluoride-specific ion channel FluC n=1 Tax=Kineococcus xinjiangensis TaxID=512762 RepID=A0A2S6IV88_9ACTN|nr:CrcB family protein [Kineococcus xinjiangensis]PPK98190.1 CrcB protein [Kineococcus xinjiangensis]